MKTMILSIMWGGIILGVLFFLALSALSVATKKEGLKGKMKQFSPPDDRGFRQGN